MRPPWPLADHGDRHVALVAGDLDARTGHSSKLDEFIASVGLEIEPVTADQARLARQAYRTCGKGNHPARLNFGDCFADALAQTTGAPLLFKSDDFAQTDLTPAV